ncbi:MAG TPA: S26 family signal peptidase [Armatimonadota bacterium]|jgi:signal peptidase I
MRLRVLLSLGVSLLVLLGYRAYNCPGEGMMPTVIPGGRFVVSTWHYRHHTLGVGDILPFRTPEFVDTSNPLYLKRAVALGGDCWPSDRAGRLRWR